MRKLGLCWLEPGVSFKQPELAEAIRQNDLQDRVILLGEIGYSAPEQCVRNCVFRVSLARRFSNSIGEAISCGVPSAVTDVGDSAYLVADSQFVAPPHDPEALANGIGHLIEIGS